MKNWKFNLTHFLVDQSDGLVQDCSISSALAVLQ